MKYWTVLSGKGGAGKTTVTASFAQLMKNGIMADCDVDAADLSLLLKGTEIYRETFYSGYMAQINQEICSSCGLCLEQCRFDAVKKDDQGKYSVNSTVCEGCGVCHDHCPEKAVTLIDYDSGICLLSETNEGILVHARLHPGGDNSGKLVSRVKELAEEKAKEKNLEKILIDGPPGIGCAVLASLNQSEQVLIVTEPTPSGLHDMERLAKVLLHFNIPGSICVNKGDINPALSGKIRETGDKLGLKWLGEIPFDPSVPAALRNGQTPREAKLEPVGGAIKKIWEKWNEL